MLVDDWVSFVVMFCALFFLYFLCLFAFSLVYVLKFEIVSFRAQSLVKSLYLFSNNERRREKKKEEEEATRRIKKK